MRSSHILAENFIQLSFADDATAITNAKTELELVKNLKDALKAFTDFCDKYNMKINVKKTFIYLFGKKCDKKKIQIFIGNEKLEITNDMNLLGIRLNNDLSFQNHFKVMSSYYQYKISLIGQFGKLCDHDITRMLVNSYLIGKFNYSSSYIPMQSENVYRNIQNKINLLIHHRVSNKEERQRFYTDHIRIPQHELLERIRCKSMKNIHRLNQMSRLGKLTETAYPPREFGQFLECLEIRGTRRQIEQRTIPFFVQKSKINANKPKRFFTTAPMMWAQEFAKLPMEIRNTIGTDFFKNNIKKYYSDRCQHQEYKLQQCRNCHKSTKEYSTPQNLDQMHRNWFQEQKRENNFTKVQQYEEWVNLLEENEDMDFNTFVVIEKDIFYHTENQGQKLVDYLIKKNWNKQINKSNQTVQTSALTYESDCLDDSDYEISMDNIFNLSQ